MNFVTVEAKLLGKALKIANAIVEPRNTIPVLSTVMLAYSRKGLIIEATDLDLAARIDVDEIDGEGEWKTCLFARQLGDIAAAAGIAEMRIELAVINDNAGKAPPQPIAVVSAGEATYEVQALSADDFPEIIGDRMQRVERFTNGQLAAMCKKVSFCISTEETRYYLNGVNWSAKANDKRFAATDGHRLAACRYASNENGESFSYIIPRKAISVISQFMDGADVDIFSIGRGNTIIDTVLDIVSPGLTLRAKLIDGNYPDFDRVIPQAVGQKLSISRDEMLTAIRQATAIGGWRGAAIRLHGLAGRMHVETKNPDFGSAKVATSSEWPENVEAIGVNSKYMAEMIKACQGEIRVGITDRFAPLTLSDDDKDMTRVVMPMRV